MGTVQKSEEHFRYTYRQHHQGSIGPCPSEVFPLALGQVDVCYAQTCGPHVQEHKDNGYKSQFEVGILGLQS